jgi:hypothetical protein
MAGGETIGLKKRRYLPEITTITTKTTHENI